ncbi:MAG: polysaccharide deacetylase family protein [Clostridia bacterium]|nr:polysaccharide deacetylase family protein [Clostridia bacterium]
MKKMKAVTFSYDDGITQDRRLIEILNKYGLKGTFNLNSALLGKEGSLLREGATVNHTKWKAAEVKAVYEGHEVAAHTRTHPLLPTLSDEEIIKEVEEDRLRLSELVGYEVVGMAYPFGGQNHNDRVVDVIRRHTGIKYARAYASSHSFAPQAELLRYKPTVYHHEEWDTMLSLAERFLEMEADAPAIFYIWGHTFEFDIHDTWDKFEDFLQRISGKNDIFYGTNREVFEHFGMLG